MQKKKRERKGEKSRLGGRGEVGRVEKGRRGQNRKNGAKGGGEEARVRINLYSLQLAPLFSPATNSESFLRRYCYYRCNMSQREPLLTDAWALRCACQRAT